MRAVFGLVLLIGMGLAGFAVYMVNQYMDEQNALLERERQRARTVVQTVDIYAPTRDLTYGDLLRAEDVALIKYPRDTMPEGVFQTEEELFPEGPTVPRVVRVPMQTYEPILASKVTAAGAPRGITALLDPGMRAFPLPDGLTRAFAGELRVSDRIDLYWVGSIQGVGDISRLVKSGLEIIAMEEGDAQGRGVVLQVSQADFAELQALQSAGSLSLSPVARVDDGGGDTTIETNLRDILGIVEEVAEEAPVEIAPEVCTRRERRGVETITIEVPCED